MLHRLGELALVGGWLLAVTGVGLGLVLGGCGVLFLLVGKE